MLQVFGRSLDLLTCSPVSYHCATAAPWSTGGNKSDLARMQSMQSENMIQLFLLNNKGYGIPFSQCNYWMTFCNVYVKCLNNVRGYSEFLAQI